MTICRVTIATVWLISEMRQGKVAEPFVHAGPILAATSLTWLRSCVIRSLEAAAVDREQGHRPNSLAIAIQDG